MKKSAKLLSLAVALLAGFGTSTAQAEGFKVGADVVSSYVWRGTELGDSPAIQPNVSYTFKDSNIVLGAWGSYALQKSTPGGISGDYRYKEVDLFATLPVGPFSFTVTDYYVPVDGVGDSFDFSNDGPNTVELSANYVYKNLGLTAAIFVAGNDYDNAKYCEATYKFYDKDGYTAKLVAGLGDDDYYGDKNSQDIALVNTGFSVAKDRYTGAYVYNPATKASSLVFMASF
ncbi:MAG TPA: hypothetical protein VN367_01250 [Chlorobaculum sp.]|jgi:hypothetical protein|nr:hypothetical protein [Chlorobaculum sp.]